MRKYVTTALVMSAFAVPAIAEETVEMGTDKVDALIAELGNTGPIRVIVRTQPHDAAAAGAAAGPTALTASAAQLMVLNTLPPDAQSTAELIGETLLVAELEPDMLRFLAMSPLVAGVEADGLSTPMPMPDLAPTPDLQRDDATREFDADGSDLAAPQN